MSIRKIVRLLTAESTNAVALDLGGKGAEAGTVVVADMQTKGRGRLKRSWMSPPGMGLYFSMVMKPVLAVENLPRITLAAGLAICKTVEDRYVLSPQLKWPNDLLLGGRKFGGILTETGPLLDISPEHPPLVVIGVGLNLFTPPGGFPPELQEHATALSEHADRSPAADDLLEQCVLALEEAIRRLVEGRFREILEEWKQRDACRGKVLSWVTPLGREVTGISMGPDADGILRIRDGAGIIHEIISGDVNLVGKIPG